MIAGDHQQSHRILVLQAPAKGPLEGVIVTQASSHEEEAFENEALGARRVFTIVFVFTFRQPPQQIN